MRKSATKGRLVVSAILSRFLFLRRFRFYGRLRLLPGGELLHDLKCDRIRVHLVDGSSIMERLR